MARRSGPRRERQQSPSSQLAEPPFPVEKIAPPLAPARGPASKSGESPRAKAIDGPSTAESRAQIRPPRRGHVLCLVTGAGGINGPWIRAADLRELPTARSGDVGWFPERVLAAHPDVLARVQG